MKNIFFIITILCTMILQLSFAQSPDFFNYQAAIRGSNGNPLSGQNVSLRISIAQGNTGGAVVYQETFQTTTDDRGLVALQIGNGTPVSGDFQMIEWGTVDHFLNIEVDENGGTNYQPIGSSQLASVPYARFSDAAAFADEAGSVELSLGDLTNVNVAAPQNDYVLTWNGTAWTGRPSPSSPWVQIGPHEIKFDSTAILSKKLTIGKNVVTAVVEKDGSGSIATDRVLARGEFRLTSGSGSLMTVSENVSGAGELIIKGANGSTNVQLGNNGNLGARGYIGVAGGGGNVKASMEVTQNDNGIIKSNRMLADATGNLSPLEAQINGNSAFKVFNNGGTGIGLGSNLSPAADGLKVAGPIETLNGLTADNAVFAGDGSTTLNPLVVKNIANQTYLQVHASNGGVSIGTNQTPPAFGLRISQDVVITNGDLDVSGDLFFGSEQIFDDASGSNRIGFSGHLVPIQDNVRSLGVSGKRWSAVWAVDNTINTSDIRAKREIKNLDYGLAEVLNMRPVSFKWKKGHDTDTRIGLIAQELLQLVPEVVKTHDWEFSEDPDEAPQKVELDTYGVAYAALIPVLIKSIQEQQKMIETLKQRITELENN